MIRRAFFAMVGLSCAVLVGNVALQCGPSVEGHLLPVRVDQSLHDVQTVGPNMLRFVWHSTKKRLLPSPDVDVFMSTADDRFPWTLSNDLSPPGAPCTVLAPWSHGYVVGLGEHDQPYCIELPRTIIGKPMRVQVVVHYRSAFGWDVPVTLPSFTYPAGAAVPL